MSSSQTLPFKAINPDLRKYGYALRGRVLILEGLIAAGKSTAGQEIVKFAESLGIKSRFFPEPLVPELLQLFLSDQKRYAYAFQLAMLIKRQAIYREARNLADQGYFCVIDRGLYGDYCFALMHKTRGNISETPTLDKSNLSEWSSYLASLHGEEFEHPDYVLYLEVSPETAIRRAMKRDREGEGKYDIAYYRELCEVYSKVIPTSPAKGIEVIDWNSDRDFCEISRFLLDKVRKLHDKTVF